MFSINVSNLTFLLSEIADIILGRKIEQIRFVRGVTNFGLKVAKDLVEAEHERRDPTRDYFGEKVLSIIREELAARLANEPASRLYLEIPVPGRRRPKSHPATPERTEA